MQNVNFGSKFGGDIAKMHIENSLVKFTKGIKTTVLRRRFAVCYCA